MRCACVLASVPWHLGYAASRAGRRRPRRHLAVCRFFFAAIAAAAAASAAASAAVSIAAILAATVAAIRAAAAAAFSWGILYREFIGGDIHDGSVFFFVLCLGVRVVQSCAHVSLGGFRAKRLQGRT